MYRLVSSKISLTLIHRDVTITGERLHNVGPCSAFKMQSLDKSRYQNVGLEDARDVRLLLSAN